MSAEITKPKAAEIIRDYLFKRFKDQITEESILDSPPEWASFYPARPVEKTFFCFIPAEKYRVGSVRMIAIHKLTGEIIFDGDVGE